MDLLKEADGNPGEDYSILQELNNPPNPVEETQVQHASHPVAPPTRPAGRPTTRSKRRQGRLNVPKVGENISYKAGEDDTEQWFDVEVFGKGKAGAKNESYLNIKYKDGSEAGIWIDKYEWKLTKNVENSDIVQSQPDGVCGSGSRGGSLNPP